MKNNGEKAWAQMNTAERLRAFAWCMNNVIAELFITAADELDELHAELKYLEEGSSQDEQ